MKPFWKLDKPLFCLLFPGDYGLFSYEPTEISRVEVCNLVFATLALFHTKIFDSPYPVSDQTSAARAHSHCYIILEVTESCSYFWFISSAQRPVKIASSKTLSCTHYFNKTVTLNAHSNSYQKGSMIPFPLRRSLTSSRTLSPISVQFSSPWCRQGHPMRI